MLPLSPRAAGTKRPRRKGKRQQRDKTDSGKSLGRRWRTPFFETLADTSNVTRACEAAAISASTVYDLRHRDSGFAANWLAALCEGNDNLEMELLERLRAGESKDEPGRKFDNATALRLLAAHRASVARGRALRDKLDEQAVLASIDAFIDRMRRRAAANAAQLASQEDGTADDGG